MEAKYLHVMTVQLILSLENGKLSLRFTSVGFSWEPRPEDVVLPLHHQCLQVLPPGAQQDAAVELSAEDSDGNGLL